MPRKARRRPWGSITTVNRGKHILRWVQNTPEGRRRLTKTVYGSYADACMELDRLHVEKSADRPVPTIGQVISKWYAPWLDQRVQDGKTKDGSRQAYSRVIERDILPRWGDILIDCAKPLDIQNWLLTLTKHSAGLAIVVLRKAMDFPVRYELIPSNPFRVNYETPVSAKYRKTSNIYTLSQAIDMLARVRGTLGEAAYILAAGGSCRLGESLGVRRDEVSAAEAHGMMFAMVEINRRVGRTGNEVMPDGDLKTPESRRTIVIPDPFASRLIEIAEEGAVPGSPWLNPKGDGDAMSCGSLGYYWRGASGADYIPFSNLRTSWRTYAQYEWGIDYDTCEVLMGHRLAGVTGSHYLKPTPSQLLEKVATALERVNH